MYFLKVAVCVPLVCECVCAVPLYDVCAVLCVCVCVCVSFVLLICAWV